jgi:hypothetical protein
MIFLLTSFSGFFKAVADTIQHHYDRSIFYGNDFFNPLVQGAIVPFTKYPFDAWHISNSGMIGCFILAACLGRKNEFILKFLITSILFILTFNLFYNQILIK